MKVVVAMSGGVDSSTVAGLLVEEGHEVIGLAMKTHDEAPTHNRACCTPDDMRDARRVADHLKIPFYVLNYTQVFREEIIAPFAEAYRRGQTPNPCVECNDKVKFRPMLERAELLGADALATGHYARLEEREGQWRLLRGVDRHKDQSYFLYRLRNEQMARLRFPIGAMTKDEVREHARRLGMPVADKTESQEICFVGAEGYAAVVERVAGGAPAGVIRHIDGRELGRHDGVHHFTLGQRRGLGISAPEPLYVTDIDADTHEVRVGPQSALGTDRVDVTDVVWSGAVPTERASVCVQQRYREHAKPGFVVAAREHAVTLGFEPAVPRGAPGQAAVIYDNDVVLGGGRIAARGSLPVLMASA